MNLPRILSLLIFLLYSSSCSQPVNQTTQAPVKIGWGVWIGWLPFKIVEEEGFLKKRAAELGVSVVLIKFDGYMESVGAFALGKLDGCTMTSMEALQPASSGIQTVAVLANDSLNFNPRFMELALREDRLLYTQLKAD